MLRHRHTILMVQMYHQGISREAAVVYSVNDEQERLLRISQKATALAAATFSESTPWYMGIFTV